MKSVAEPRSRANGQYHYLVTEQGVEAARTLAKKLLEENKNNVAVVARIMGTTRPTIRRAKVDEVSNKSRRPKLSPNTSSPELTKLISGLRLKLGYGRIRLSRHIKMEIGTDVKPTTIQNILTRLDVPRQDYKRPKVSKPLYDYEQLLPFEEMQIDCKYVEDYQALGKLAFIPRKLGLPSYQWTAIDVLTKTKFLAYSHVPPNALFGQWFMLFVVWWLRAHGVLGKIELQADNGAEWAKGSKLKEERIKAMLEPYGAGFHSIPAGKKYLQGVVERTHRTDDEEFYRPHLGRVKDKGDFMSRAQRYQDTFNTRRQNWGRAMNGVTPVQKLKEKSLLGAERLAAFPVFCIDDLFDGVRELNYYVSMTNKASNKAKSESTLLMQDLGLGGGKDVCDHYQNSFVILWLVKRIQTNQLTG